MVAGTRDRKLSQNGKNPRPDGLGQAGRHITCGISSRNFAKVILRTNPSQSNLVPSKVHKQRSKGLSNGRLGPHSVSKLSFKTQTDLSKNVEPLIDASVKWRAEMSQTQAVRPINHVFWTQSFSTDLQERIQAVHKKSVTKWWNAQARRPRGGRPTPLFSISSSTSRGSYINRPTCLHHTCRPHSDLAAL